MGSSQRSKKTSKRNQKSKSLKVRHALRCKELLKGSHSTTSIDNGSSLGNMEKNIIENISSENHAQIDLNNSWGTDAEFESIMQHKLTYEVEKSQNTCSSVISGNRVVNLGYVLDWALSLQTNHNQICTGGRIYLSNEVKNGLESTLIFKCSMCSKIIEKTTDVPSKKNKSSKNIGAVWGIMISGSCHRQLEQMLTTLNVPAITFRKFAKIEKLLGESWQEYLITVMKEAGKEEYKIAVEKGHIDEDGIPFITVCVDGGWSKRSYGHNYNAASGVAVIIGKATNKVLFVGVRNKFCYVCVKALNQGLSPSTHVCFKNWNGSSSAMEASILVEGFSKSIEMYSLRYKYFIADGDSSTFAKLKMNVSYGSSIEKIECKNHACKNYSKKLYKIKKDKRNTARNKKLLSVKCIKSLVDLSKRQIAYNSKFGNIQQLREDLQNGPNHIFKNHLNCKTYYCDIEKCDKERKVEALQSSGFFQQIQGALEFLIKKANVLIRNETNNNCEHFMSLLAKYNAGKRLNLTMRGGFTNRCLLSALSYNKDQIWQESSWKNIINQSPGTYFKRFLRKKERILKYRRSHKSNCRKQLFTVMANNNDYGSAALEADLCPEELQKECQRVIQNMQVTSEERENILRDTVGQFGNTRYEVERQNRLTSSYFGKIIKRRDWTPCHNDVVAILYNNHFSSDATCYGKTFEKVVLNILKDDYQIISRSSGLFVDLNYGFLGASPDALVDDDGLVEIKCLYSLHKSGKSLEEAAKTNTICLELTSANTLQLKRNHNYYFQVQGQLNISGRRFCYFVVYVDDNHPIHMETIFKDEECWHNKMLPKLVQFYTENVAPEMIRRNHIKKLKCVSSNFILNSIKKRGSRMLKYHTNS